MRRLCRDKDDDLLLLLSSDGSDPMPFHPAVTAASAQVCTYVTASSRTRPFPSC
jgi:hypothetical protein